MSKRNAEFGAVMLEAILALSVLALLTAILLDIRFYVVERSALQEAARLGARVAAGTSARNFTEEELRDFAVYTTERALDERGLKKQDYAITVWGISKTPVAANENHVQVSIESTSTNRFYLLPESNFSQCVGSSYYLMSREPIASSTSATAQNRCNPGRHPSSQVRPAP